MPSSFFMPSFVMASSFFMPSLDIVSFFMLSCDIVSFFMASSLPILSSAKATGASARLRENAAAARPLSVRRLHVSYCYGELKIFPRPPPSSDRARDEDLLERLKSDLNRRYFASCENGDMQPIGGR